MTHSKLFVYVMVVVASALSGGVVVRRVVGRVGLPTLPVVGKKKVLVEEIGRVNVVNLDLLVGVLVGDWLLAVTVDGCLLLAEIADFELIDCRVWVDQYSSILDSSPLGSGYAFSEAKYGRTSRTICLIFVSVYFCGLNRTSIGSSRPPVKSP